MTDVAVPGAGTRLFFLDGEGVLFSEPRQELHRLNTTAAVIWCLLEEGRTAAEMAADLTSRFGIPPGAAHDYIGAALAGWAAKGLLAGAEGPPCPPRPPPGWAPRPGLPAYPSDPPSAFVAVRRYRLLTTRFAVRYATAAQFARLHPVLAHLEEAGGSAPEDVRLDLLAAGTATVLYRDAEPVEACAEDDALAPAAYAVIWMTALQRHAFAFDVHAAVLRMPGGEGGGCVLLPAPPGSGKSILTAALVQAGFDYFSDEVALLSGEDLRVAPFPQAICIKESGIAAAAACRPDAAGLPLHRRADGKRVAYLPPPPERLPAPEARGTVHALVFPRYHAGATPRCAPVPKAEALARLLGQCTVIEGRLDAALVGRLVAWVAGLECRDLVYGATADGVAAVRDVLAGAAASRSSRRTRNVQTTK